MQEAIITVSGRIRPVQCVDGRTRVSDGVLGIGIENVVNLSGGLSRRDRDVMANILQGERQVLPRTIVILSTLR